MDTLSTIALKRKELFWYPSKIDGDTTIRFFRVWTPCGLQSDDLLVFFEREDG